MSIPTLIPRHWSSQQYLNSSGIRAIPHSFLLRMNKMHSRLSRNVSALNQDSSLKTSLSKNISHARKAGLGNLCLWPPPKGLLSWFECWSSAAEPLGGGARLVECPYVSLSLHCEQLPPHTPDAADSQLPPPQGTEISITLNPNSLSSLM